LMLSGLLIVSNTNGQEAISPNWTIDVQFSSVQPFGPSEGGAEIAGGHSPHSYDEKWHYTVGFRSSGNVRLGASWNTGEWRLKASSGFMSYRLALVDNFYRYEDPLGKIKTVDLRLSGMARLSGKRNIPSGFYTGIFFSSTAATGSLVYDDMEELYEMENPDPGMCFHWGIEAEYLWSTGEKGLHFGFNTMVTMPGTAGDLGKLRLGSDSSYQIREDRIRVYAFGAGITVGMSI
ncbi:MAG: hypothetical protein RL220_143, partial [Bacteroidota bacterium]